MKPQRDERAKLLLQGATMTGYQTYQGNQVEGAGPLGLILLTYDALYKSLGRIRMSIAQGDFQAEAEQTAKAMDALIELTTALDMQQGGEVAKNLASLYAYMMKQLSTNLCSGSTTAVDEIMPLVESLHSGWKELSQQQSSQHVVRPQVGSVMPSAAMAYAGA